MLNIPVKRSDNEEFVDIKPIAFSIVLNSSNKFNGIRGILGEWLSGRNEQEMVISLNNNNYDYSEISEENLSRASKYRISPEIVTIKPFTEDWERLSGTFRDKMLCLHLKPNEAAAEPRERFNDYVSLVERPRSSVRADEFFDFFSKITGIYMVVGRTSYFETLGVSNHGLRLIASNGTLTDHEITFTSTSSTWYLETIHLIVNLDATLNLGKRHLADARLVGRTREFLKAIYPNLVRISKCFVERDSGGPDDEPMPEVINTEAIRRDKVPFRRFPTDENALIGIFSSVMSQLDAEFKVFGLFSKARYDGKFIWTGGEPPSDSDLKKLEFKRQLDVLIGEFESATHDKEFKDVDLVIVWDRRILSLGWSVKGVSASRKGGLENVGVPTDLIEFVLEDRHGNYRPLISVPDLLQKIPLIAGQADGIEGLVTRMG